MASKQSNVRKLKTQPKLTSDEIKRIAEKISVELEHDEEPVSLLLLFLDHVQCLAEQGASNMDIWSAFYDFKKHLFLGCPAADAAQDRFQADAYRNRGKLLLWPSERRSA